MRGREGEPGCAAIGWRRGFKPERGAVGAARGAGAGAAAQVRDPEGTLRGSGECREG